MRITRTRTAVAAIGAVALVTGVAVTAIAATSAPTATCNPPTYDGTTLTVSCTVPQSTVTATTTAPGATTTVTAPGPTTTVPGPTTTVTTTVTTSAAPTTSTSSATPTPTPTTTAPSGGIKPLTPGTTWQWQLTGTVNETILDGVSNTKKMIDLDMENTDAATIARLKAKGIVLICYIEVGSWESYRSDAGSFPASVLGATMGGYPDERYTDIRQISVLRPIMDARLDRAKAKGCDGIEPDIDDSWQENTGFPLTLANELAYMGQVIADTHARGMSIGQKNGPVSAFTSGMLARGADWALTEQCNQYSECGTSGGNYASYIAAGKAVFNAEYTAEGETIAKFCPADNAANFDGLLKKSSETLAALPRTACRFG